MTDRQLTTSREPSALPNRPSRPFNVFFIAMLAFADEGLLNAAKLGVLLGSVVAAVLDLGWGAIYVRSLR
jgi:hypothetical protein